MTRLFKGAELHRALREPILHFAVGSLLLFAIHSVATMVRGKVIEINPTALEIRIWQTEAARGVSLTEAERAVVEAQYFEEQVLVREARALGLDRDPRIDDILVQKMLHVLSGDVIQPGGEELERHYRENLERYTPQPSMTLTEIVVSGSSTPTRLIEQLRRGDTVDGEAYDDVRQRNLGRMTAPDLTELVGLATAEEVFASRLGEWVGPHRTLQGEHWFRGTELHPATPYPFATVRDQVRMAWIDEQEAQLLSQRVDELLQRYSLRMGRP
jgi:hypothetical protein